MLSIHIVSAFIGELLFKRAHILNMPRRYLCSFLRIRCVLLSKKYTLIWKLKLDLPENLFVGT